MKSEFRYLACHAKRIAIRPLLVAAVLCLPGCASIAPRMNRTFQSCTLDYDSRLNPTLQARLEAIDASVRSRYGMTTEQAAVGALDSKSLRLAMIHPDRIEYAASVPKIGISAKAFARTLLNRKSAIDLHGRADLAFADLH